MRGQEDSKGPPGSIRYHWPTCPASANGKTGEPASENPSPASDRCIFQVPDPTQSRAAGPVSAPGIFASALAACSTACRISPTVIYGLPEGSPFFAELQVSPTGLTVLSPAGAVCCNQSTGSLVASDGTLLYTNSGEVWNPTTQKLLRTHLESNGSQLLYSPSVVPDTSNGHTYFLDGDGQYAQYQAVNIDVYDQASYALLGTVPFTSIYPPDVTDLVRWGSNGFAFRCVDITGSEPSANQIVNVTSNLVFVE